MGEGDLVGDGVFDVVRGLFHTESEVARSGDVEDTLFRRGAVKFSGKRLPMNMDTVRSVADQYGIPLDNWRITIRKDRFNYFGSTSPNGSSMLARDAFNDEPTLARTLYHERYHAKEQVAKGVPYPQTQEDTDPWEEPAYAAEEAWWASHPLNPDSEVEP